MPDTTAIVSALAAQVGPERVITDPDRLNAASHDTWPLSTKLALLGRHDQRPDVIVAAGAPGHICAVLRVAASLDVPVTVRALGSSVTGQPLPVAGGIVLDLSAMPATYTLDTENLTVEATASHNGGALEDALNERGWTLGHSPQSLYRSTVGGWVATLATGQFSSLYGGIEDLLCACTVILATGETVRLGSVPRGAVGPDLRHLFMGSEGTLGIVTSVQLKVFPLPEKRLLQTYRLPGLDAGIAVLREQAALGLRPFLLRLYDSDEARHVAADADQPLIIAGTQGPDAIARAELDALTQVVGKHAGTAAGPGPAQVWMRNRFDFSMVENLLAEPGGFAETIEVAHTWRGILPLYRDLKPRISQLADEVLVHFSHVYTSGTSMYVIPIGRADTDEEAVARLEKIWETAMRVCLEHGAVLSHHHGGGLARSRYLRQSLGPAHLVLRRLKSALDPDGTLNPGKLGL
jgi:alkyldihydroxyacetonephosphate synthase